MKFAQRAFVIEFAGTPKSGKSTAVEAVRHFFSRQGFRVHVLAERAALCPIPMKGHLFFNTWCATSMLAELLANIETDTDIIIVDRGIFDALVWLKLQLQRGELTQDESEKIEAFLLLERWRSLIDLTIVMRVDAEEAMRREINQRITNKPGSIMNPEVLATITNSVKSAVSAYGASFRETIDEDTTASRDVRESNTRLAVKIVQSLDEFLNPEILVIPTAKAKQLPLANGGEFRGEAVAHILDCISSHGSFMRRADAESDSSVVQIVSCGVLAKDNEVFLFRRKETDPKSKLYGRTTIWQGTHVARASTTGLALLESALTERITKSLFLSRVFPLQPRGYCWDESNPHSSKHLGVLFRIDIDNSHTAQDLRKKEFRKGRDRDHDLVGQFIDWQTLKKESNDLALESWSETTLKALPDFN